MLFFFLKKKNFIHLRLGVYLFVLSPSDILVTFSMLQDVLVIKPQKKSPLLLRMSVLIFSMVCGVFICSVCVKQISTQARTKLLELQTIENPSRSIVKLTHSYSPYLHYPNPLSFNR